MKIRYCFVLLISICFVSACLAQAVPEATYNILLSKTEAMPAGRSWDLVWPVDQSLQVFMEINDQLSVYSVDTKSLTPIGLENDDLCTRRTDYVRPEVLPDGRIGFIKRCLGLLSELSPIEGESFIYQVAFDPISKQVTQIVKDPISRSLNSTPYTWNPDMTLGMQSTGGTKGTIFWVSQEGPYPLDLTLSAGRNSWNLADSWDYEAIWDNDDVGIANQPAWSSDGNIISFVANLRAIGVSGLARWEFEYKLYLMDPEELLPDPVLDGIYFPGNIIWSPNSKWIAIHASMGNAIVANEGLWIYSPSSDILLKVAQENFAHIEWSPDSQSIATVACLDDLCNQAEVRLYDLTELFSSQ